MVTKRQTLANRRNTADNNAIQVGCLSNQNDKNGKSENAKRSEPNIGQIPGPPNQATCQSRLENLLYNDPADLAATPAMKLPKSMKTFSRRSFTAAMGLGPWVVRAQPSPLHARVKIDTERVIGDIDPKIYGNFIEHLGRCIDGGVFDEKSPLSDSNGFRKDVMAAVKDLNVSILRWPGGNFSSNYHWMDGIGPRDNRPPRLEMAWGTVESNRFGTHDFMKYVEMVGAEPYFCTNLGTGTWTEAQQWVEYCNSPLDTAMTRLRKQNGRADPWKVTYWGLGNEMDGPWQMGHRTADDYGKFALEAAKLMKLTDPSIKLIAAAALSLRPTRDAADAVPEMFSAMGAWRN